MQEFRNQDVQEFAQARGLRERLELAHCEFEFLARPAPDTVTEADHRAILDDLFRAIDSRIVERFERFAAHDPALRASGCWRPRWDATKATATPWTEADLIDPTEFGPGFRITLERERSQVYPMEWLAQAFDDPPYKAECPPGLFADFCSLVGLWPGEGASVLDWVAPASTTDEDAAASRAAWNTWFEAGLEWWGVWCLTIYNPQRGTLAALTASTTD